MNLSIEASFTIAIFVIVILFVFTNLIPVITVPVVDKTQLEKDSKIQSLQQTITEQQEQIKELEANKPIDYTLAILVSVLMLTMSATTIADLYHSKKYFMQEQRR